MEDFGYLKYEEQSKILAIIKKFLVIGAILLSISCFVYITISAYYFIYHEENSNIEIVKSPENLIKTTDVNDSNIVIKNMDKAVYENIVGGKKESLRTEDIKVVTTNLPDIFDNNRTKSGTIKHSRIIDANSGIIKNSDNKNS